MRLAKIKMHVTTTSCILLLWMHTLTFVKSQDNPGACTLEDFKKYHLYDGNFDISGMQASYPGGRQVKVGCNVGYSGFFKLLCVEGKWQHRGTNCQPRSCGHPGDAQFADFQLRKGDDFVFGSEVVYTCHKGFQMVSRTNFRRCMAEGWDGVIPVCEAQQCPSINVPNNVNVIGDAEEATYGNVVRFSCKSSNYIMKGAREIYCDENGDWKGLEDGNPTCEVVKCEPPRIENGFVLGDIKEYNEREILNFECNPQHKRVQELPSRCTKTGDRAEWIPTPECEVIKCELTLPPLQGTTYEPAHRSRFSPGETVTVTCEERYWIWRTRTRSVETTCNEDGQWSVRPVCQEVTCIRPQDRLLSYWEASWRDETKKLGDTVRYTCRSGYKRKDGVTRATCTRDGWEPNPLCEEINCRRKQFNNADITGKIQAEYRYNEHVQYNCKRGYEGRFTLTCREDGWHGSNECTEIKCELTLPPLQGTTYEPAHRSRFSPGETVTVTCEERYWIGRTRTRSVETTCIENEQWSVRPVCQEVTCIRPQERLFYYWEASWRDETKKLGDTVRYTCRSGYKRKDGVTRATCTRDGWEPNPLCEEIKCRRKQFNNADITGKIQAEYRYNEHVQYNCKRGYEGRFTLTCREDGWHGSNECTAVSTCEAPVIENGFVPGDIKEYNEREILNFECNPQHKRAQELPSRCTKTGDRAEWIPTPECEEIKCELTLPPLQGTTYEPAHRSRFSPGETVTVTCEERYWIGRTRTRSVETTCNEDGQWSVRPVCQEVTCIRPQDRLLSYWEASWRGETKKLGDTVRYTCRSGYKRKDGVTRATCTRDGWEPNPLCQEIPPCGIPPALEDGDTKTAIKEHYSHNETIEYMCQSYYIMEGEPYKTCLYGEWTGHMRCLRPCIVNEDEMRQHNITLKSSGTKYLVHDEIIEFRCTRGLSTGTVAMRQRCNSGVLVLPTCRE
ncbi:complement factor H-like isoform X4 [Simochromis diagramma]|uniref:complement factor H-like isoform X4 n=1 Tax=Simochromis diagramma TaxID=43689 RepID=UPI001A7E3807|nr:complement factor H-like isoform X4 [Simochromis diagramma]